MMGWGAISVHHPCSRTFTILAFQLSHPLSSFSPHLLIPLNPPLLPLLLQPAKIKKPASAALYASDILALSSNLTPTTLLLSPPETPSDVKAKE